MDQPRDPRGTPGGGQFAAKDHAAVDADLGFESLEDIEIDTDVADTNPYGMDRKDLTPGTEVWINGTGKATVVVSGVDDISERGFEIPANISEGDRPVLVKSGRDQSGNITSDVHGNKVTKSGFQVVPFSELSPHYEQAPPDMDFGKKHRAESLTWAFQRLGIDVKRIEVGGRGSSTYVAHTDNPASAAAVAQEAMSAFDEDPESGRFAIDIKALPNGDYSTTVMSDPETSTPSPASLASRSNAILACKERFASPVHQDGKIRVARADSGEGWRYRIKVDDFEVHGEPLN